MNKRAVFVAALLLALPWVSSAAGPTKALKVVDHGDDARRKVIAVMGDGYSSSPADKAQYLKDVQRLVLNGLLAKDFYAAHADAFNVYVIDLVSQDSGVSTQNQQRNTALGVTYNSSQADCWVTEASNTQTAVVAAATAAQVPRVDFYFVIPHVVLPGPMPTVFTPSTPGYGGCASGSVLYVTSRSPYTVASHEFGHGIGSLFDEYSAGFGANQDIYNEFNCTSSRRRSVIVWGSKINASTPVPTMFTSGMNHNTTVGAFKGCDFYESGVFRPVDECRMNILERDFCPVCLDIMQTAIKPYMPTAQELLLWRQRGGVPQRDGRPRGQRVLFQRPSPAQPAPQPTYVSLVLQVFMDGRIEILRATQDTGDAVAPSTKADSIFKITRNNAVIAAGALPHRWFDSRSYGGKTAHSNKPAKSSVLSLTIPNTTLNALLAPNTSLSLDVIAPSVRMQPVTPQWVASLKPGTEITQKYSMPAQSFNMKLQAWVQANRGR